MLGRAVAVGGGRGGVDGARLGLGRVQPPLELAEHRAEQQVAPCRLGERAAGAPQLRQLRSEAREQRRCTGQVARCSASPASGPRRTGGTGSERRTLRVDGAERGAVEQVHAPGPRGTRRSRARPGRPSSSRVVVAAPRTRACRAAAGPPTPRRRRRPPARRAGFGSRRPPCPGTVTPPRGAVYEPPRRGQHPHGPQPASCPRPRRAASTRSSTGSCARCCSRSRTSTGGCRGSAASTSRSPAR